MPLNSPDADVQVTADLKVSPDSRELAVVSGGLWRLRPFGPFTALAFLGARRLDPLGRLMSLQAEIAELKVPFQVLQEARHGDQTLFHDQQLGLGLVGRMALDQHL